MPEITATAKHLGVNFRGFKKCKRWSKSYILSDDDVVVFVFLWNDLGMKYDLHEGCEQNLPRCFLRKLLFCVLFFQTLKYDYSLFHQMFFEYASTNYLYG